MLFPRSDTKYITVCKTTWTDRALELETRVIKVPKDNLTGRKIRGQDLVRKMLARSLCVPPSNYVRGRNIRSIYRFLDAGTRGLEIPTNFHANHMAPCFVAHNETHTAHVRTHTSHTGSHTRSSNARV